MINLSRMGNRWAGSKGERTAGEYIHDAFVKIGLQDVHYEEFPYLHYEPLQAELELLSPIKLSIRCEPLQYTANSSVEGELVYVGDSTEGRLKELEKVGVSIRGKIAVVRNYFPYMTTPLLEKRGVIGMIYIGDSPEDLIRHIPAKLYPHPIKPPFDKHIAKFPGVIVRLADGERILSLLSSGKVKTHLSQRGEYRKDVAKNVVGTLYGTSLQDETIMTGAHYDTQRVGGAWDDGTGVAGLIELARILKTSKPRRSIVFAGFSCEEVGLWGSAAYVDAHKKELEKCCRCMVNIDAPSCSLTTVNCLQAWPRSFHEFCLDVCHEVGWRVGDTLDLSTMPAWDATPFIDAGIPAVSPWESLPVYPYYHTEKDSVEYIDPFKLARTLGVHGMITAKVANLEKVGWTP